MNNDKSTRKLLASAKRAAKEEKKRNRLLADKIKAVAYTLAPRIISRSYIRNGKALIKAWAALDLILATIEKETPTS
jgi:KaiC/GvpD/RAD55 family RecA-like ATPase